jgi:hypothetical protein
MKKLALVSAIALFSVSTFSFGASLQSLNKNQIEKTMANKTMTTVSLVTLNKELVSNTLTFAMDKKDNKVTGQFANKPDSDPQNDTGKWQVKSNGTLCVTWEHWNNAKPICVAVYKTNNAIMFVNQENNNFESMVLTNNIKDGDHVG